MDRAQQCPHACEVTARLAVDLGTGAQMTPPASWIPPGTTQGPHSALSRLQSFWMRQNEFWMVCLGNKPCPKACLLRGSCSLSPSPWCSEQELRLFWRPPPGGARTARDSGQHRPSPGGLGAPHASGLPREGVLCQENRASPFCQRPAPDLQLSVRPAAERQARGRSPPARSTVLTGLTVGAVGRRASAGGGVTLSPVPGQLARNAASGLPQTTAWESALQRDPGERIAAGGASVQACRRPLCKAWRGEHSTCLSVSPTLCPAFKQVSALLYFKPRSP